VALADSETDANGVQMKKVLLWIAHWARFPDTRDFYLALAALVRQVQNILTSPHTFSFYVFPSPSNLGGQSYPVACLNMYLREKESVAGIQNECFQGESLSHNLS
jgi:hypothetical protein